MHIFGPFITAMQFLSALPIHTTTPPDNPTIGHSLLYYPLVGLILGALLGGLAWGLDDINPLLSAAIILTCWVLFTGGLHLDGLADSADAWMGGLGDRERTLAIMKDPYCGPVAVVSLVLVLLIKFCALQLIVTTPYWVVLILIPMLGRTQLIILFLSTPYVRDNGIGSVLADYFPRQPSKIAVIIAAIFTPLMIGLQSIWLLVIVTIVFLALRRLMMRRLGGATGDTAGALVELSETALLVVAALLT
jgi:adenosylcobinamide-GDP ribazoletransferase